jgi:hypothetical protein
MTTRQTHSYNAFDVSNCNILAIWRKLEGTDSSSIVEAKSFIVSLLNPRREGLFLEGGIRIVHGAGLRWEEEERMGDFEAKQ